MAWNDARGLLFANPKRAAKLERSSVDRCIRTIMNAEQEELPAELRDPPAEPRRRVIKDGVEVEPPSYRLRFSTFLVSYQGSCTSSTYGPPTEGTDHALLQLIGAATGNEAQRLNEVFKGTWRIAAFALKPDASKKQRRIVKRGDSHIDTTHSATVEWNRTQSAEGGLSRGRSTIELVPDLGVRVQVAWFDIERREEDASEAPTLRHYLETGRLPRVLQEERVQAIAVLRERAEGPVKRAADLPTAKRNAIVRLLATGMGVDDVALAVDVEHDIVAAIHNAIELERVAVKSPPPPRKPKKEKEAETPPETPDAA